MVITVYNTLIHTRTWVVSAEVVVGRGSEFVEEAVDGVGLLVDDGHDEVLAELQSRFVPRPVVQTLVPCRNTTQHNISFQHFKSNLCLHVFRRTADFSRRL